MQFKWDQAFGKTLLSVVTILGMSTNLLAYDGTNSNTRQNCKKKGQMPNNYAFSYPKDLNLLNPYDCYFHIEGLAFQGRETGTSFLIDNNSPGTSGQPALNGKIAGFSGDNHDWDYNFGLRVGAGAYVNHDAWNVDFTWTWINMTNSKDFTADEDGVLIPTWALGADTSGVASGASARGNWQCIMHVLDAALGKAYHVSRKVVFNPHFGLRFAWVDQDYSAHYGGFQIQSNPTNIFHGENDFWGVGARIGIDTDWIVGQGFKFFANASTSILAGKFKTENEFQAPGQTLQERINIDLDDDFHTNVPNLELALGIDWGTYLYDDKYYLDFRAGYEFQVWWDQFNLRKFSSSGTGGSVGNFTGNFTNDTVSRGMLTLNGFTFRIQLDI